MDTSPETPGTISADDSRLFRRAVELGRRGWGRVHPNPLVGCVLVRNDEVIGEGWHREFGGPHAEVMALENAGQLAKGSTAYVSFEPCRHYGKTAPCVDALSKAGVRRVVFGASDPGEVSGGGGARLRGLGIQVEGPVLSSREARRENPGFFLDDGERPWLALKLAMSLDGKISAAPGLRTRISSPESDTEVQRLRAGFDAILVGSNTARIDDPLLTVRGDYVPRVVPLRVLLDAEGKVRPESRVLEPGGGLVIFLTTGASTSRWRDEIQARGGSVIEVDSGQAGGVSLSAALEALRLKGTRTILCEGGGVLGSGLLREGLVDRLHLILAPTLVGTGGVAAFPWPAPLGSLNAACPDGLRDWELIDEPRRIGKDTWITLEPGGA